MNKNFMALISLMVVPISGLAIDIFVPSLPHVADFYHVDNVLAQLSVTIYITGYALSQIVSGLIVDMTGTRKASILSLFLFVILSLFILIATNIYVMITLRLLQGICVGFFAVSQRVIILHLFGNDTKKLHNMINYSQIAWSIGPIIAPALGGYLEQSFGWQSTFIFLASYSGLVLTLVIFFAPETLKEKRSFDLKQVMLSYRSILTNLNFNLGLLCMGCIYTIIIVFNTV